jgi:DNA-binding GntR family transcriptional regulator
LRSEEDLAELHRIESGMGVLEPGHERRFAMLDAKLHDVIARACGNPLIRRQLERLYAHLHLFRVRRDPIVMTGALDEHRMVVSAIERGDSLVAEAAMRSHLERSRARILATFD